MQPSGRLPAGEDADWVIITEMMSRQEYKRQYPKADNLEYNFRSGLGDSQAQWETKTEIRLAEYYRVRRTCTEYGSLYHDRSSAAGDLSHWLYQWWGNRE